MLRKFSIGAMTLIVVSVLIGTNVMSVEARYDIVIRGGQLYLGGLEEMGGLGDVAIRGDRIVEVGEVSGDAEREIDASGMIVAPGFIDLHTHTDLPFKYLGSIPKPRSIKANINYIYQGVTTVVTGNCGSGLITANGMEKWMEKMDRMGFGSNIIHLVPYGELRRAVMGEGQAAMSDHKPTPEQLEEMKKLLREGMELGAWGMSTGLEYDPDARADTSELIELDKVVAEYDGVYASHIRHEGPDPGKYIAAVKEAIEIGEKAGTRVQISHIKSAGKPVHGMSDEVIEIIESARARGVSVVADQYPYIAGSTTLSYVVPVEKRDGEKVEKQYCTDEGKAGLYDEVAEIMETQIPADKIMISLYPWKPWLQGKTVAEVAASRGEDPVKTAIDLACGPVGVGIYFSQNEDDLRNFMRRDWVTTGSDGFVFLKFIGKAHPRLYGTFPRKIRKYVYEEGLITLPFALRSMTELPATAFEIPERGKLAAGYFADVVVFNPETIRDKATWRDPNQYSEGIEYLMVNGVISIDQGKYTGRRGGRVLRHKKR